MDLSNGAILNGLLRFFKKNNIGKNLKVFRNDKNFKFCLFVKGAVGIQYSYGLHFLNFGAKYLF